MPQCQSCHENFSFMKLNGGLCFDCQVLTAGGREAPSTLAREAEERQHVEDLARWQKMMLTTETAGNFNIQTRLGIVSAECAFGMHIFKDIFAGARDIFGGRSKAIQDTLKDARTTALDELRIEAGRLGANAVVAVALAYSEISGSGKSMLFLVASGTAVIVKDDQT